MKTHSISRDHPRTINNKTCKMVSLGVGSVSTSVEKVCVHGLGITLVKQYAWIANAVANILRKVWQLFCEIWTSFYSYSVKTLCLQIASVFVKILLVIHRCGSRQIFAGGKEWCPDSAKLARKIRQINDLQKKAFHVISGAIIFKSKHVGHHFCIFRWKSLTFRWFWKVVIDFVRILWDLPGFSPNQNFWGFGCSPAPPPPSPVC